MPFKGHGTELQSLQGSETTFDWAYNPTCNWSNLYKAVRETISRVISSCWGRLVSPGAFVARPGIVGSPRSIRWGEHPSLPTW